MSEEEDDEGENGGGGGRFPLCAATLLNDALSLHISFAAMSGREAGACRRPLPLICGDRVILRI